MYTYYYTTRWNFYNTKSQQYNTHLSASSCGHRDGVRLYLPTYLGV